MNQTDNFRKQILSGSIKLGLIALGLTSSVSASEITLKEALNIALNRSDQGKIIAGGLEVAEQEYYAERINFILPEISINGSLPAYSDAESFRFFGGSDIKSITRTTDLNFRSDITLNQALITGGDLIVKANLDRNESTYPLSGLEVDETSRRGIFDFSFTQPLLRPSTPKNRLNNRKDDLEIARIVKREEEGVLSTDVIEAYFGLLQTDLKIEISQAKLKSATLQAIIDSTKFSDGILPEEDWLATSSDRLDAELETFDLMNQRSTRLRELASLINVPVGEEIVLSKPSPGEPLEEGKKQMLLANWERSLPLIKAWHEYKKADRAAGFAAGGHGLNGSIEANYSLGRGKVDVTGFDEQNNNTNSWGISVNFNYPIWDGGSSSAAVKASYLSAEKSRLVYESQQKAAKAEIEDLLNRIDIGFRKMSILEKQIELTANRKGIARFRSDDGQISEVTYLESEIAWLEARDRYLEELKKYLIDKVSLDSKYRG